MKKQTYRIMILAAVLMAASGNIGFAKEAVMQPEPAVRPCMAEVAEKVMDVGRAAYTDAEMAQKIKSIGQIRIEIPERKEAASEAGSAVSQDTQKLLASIIFCEAGNQSYEGQVAVGAVVMNRVRSASFPDTVEEVIYQAGQFSPAGSGWLNRVRNSGGYTDSAMQAAADALNGSNPVGGCLYFDRGGSGMQIGDHFFH